MIVLFVQSVSKIIENLKENRFFFIYLILFGKGCGLNLNNVEPTMSIAKAIEELGPNKPSLSLERYLASVFTRLEYIIDQCQVIISLKIIIFPKEYIIFS